MASEDEDEAASEEVAPRAVTAEISNEMVRLYKDIFGRGPTRVRTDFAGPDTVISTLWDTLTSGERSLLEIGHHDRARETRILFQYARAADFIGIIEPRLHRKVVAFVSGIDVSADVASEVFYLEPRSHDQADPDDANAG